MKNTLITAFVSVFLGGIAVYFLMQKPVLQPISSTTPLQNPIQPPKEKPTYTESEVQAKLNLQRELSNIKQNWKELITCEKNGGEQGGLLIGGFKDVTIRIKNNSRYDLDNAVIGVFIYRGIGENKQCHYEPIMFENIPAKTEKSKKYSHPECGQRLDVIMQAVVIESIGFSSAEIE